LPNIPGNQYGGGKDDKFKHSHNCLSILFAGCSPVGLMKFNLFPDRLALPNPFFEELSRIFQDKLGDNSTKLVNYHTIGGYNLIADQTKIILLRSVIAQFKINKEYK
jgi:hypothetical protein